MDERLTAIRDFISSREPGVTSFLTTVNRYGDAYVRQVSCLVESFESGLRLGTIGRCARATSSRGTLPTTRA